MKALCFSLTLLVLVGALGCSDSGVSNKYWLSTADYSVYTHYSYGGPRPQSDTTLYFCVCSRAAFDSLFGFIADHNVQDTIPQGCFPANRAVAIVTYGHSFHVLGIQSVNVFGETLYLAYSDSITAQNMTWIAAVPIITVTSAHFTRVQFIANGVPVKDLVVN